MDEYFRLRYPICGETFCEICGDCLSCYDGDPCRDGGSHQWPPMSDEEKEIARQKETTP